MADVPRNEFAWLMLTELLGTLLVREGSLEDFCDYFIRKMLLQFPEF